MDDPAAEEAEMPLIDVNLEAIDCPLREWIAKGEA